MREAVSHSPASPASPGEFRDRPARLVASRTGVVTLGLAGLAFFAVVCLQKNVALIQDDIQVRASAALAEAEMGWADVAVSGRDVTLSGAAPSENARAAAAGVAHVRGVRALRNRIVATPLAEAGAVTHELAFVFDGHALSVEGVVPSGEAAARLQRAAAQRFTADSVTASLARTPDAPARWIEAAIAVLPLLAALDEGVAVLRHNSLSVKGVAADAAAAARLQDAVRTSLPPGYEGIVALSVAGEAEPSTPAAYCQRRFNALLGRSRIGFATGAATIDTGSHALLEELAQVASNCPDARIEIGGHTDNVGTTQGNVALSQQRAESVMRYLTLNGVPLRRLTARGYGEEMPLADNASPAGRALNRRIELIVLDGD